MMTVEEFASEFDRIFRATCPLYEHLRAGDVAPEGFKFTALFGGISSIAHWLIATHGEQVVSMRHRMRIKALALSLNRACLDGDKNFKPLKRGGDVKVRFECNYDDLGRKIANKREVYGFAKPLDVWLSPPVFTLVDNVGIQVDYELWCRFAKALPAAA